MSTEPTPQPVIGWTVEQALDVADDQAECTGKEFCRALLMLAWEVRRQREVIRGYVNHVESGEKFDALVSLVPGLVSDDGAYGAVGQ